MLDWLIDPDDEEDYDDDYTLEKEGYELELQLEKEQRDIERYKNNV